MKINVELNENSIKKAISVLKKYKMAIKGFYSDVCDYLIELANRYLDSSDIGESVKADIKSSWHRQISENGVKIYNDSDKAVFVEFGVGEIGQNNPHPNSGAEGYAYNVPSVNKYGTENHPNQSTWRFIVKNIDEVDLEDGYYEKWRMASGATKIITTGSPAVMYAYNAIVTAREDSKNPNGRIANLLNENMERYMK